MSQVLSMVRRRVEPLITSASYEAVSVRLQDWDEGVMEGVPRLVGRLL